MGTIRIAWFFRRCWDGTENIEDIKKKRLYDGDKCVYNWPFKVEWKVHCRDAKDARTHVWAQQRHCHCLRAFFIKPGTRSKWNLVFSASLMKCFPFLSNHFIKGESHKDDEPPTVFTALLPIKFTCCVQMRFGLSTANWSKKNHICRWMWIKVPSIFFFTSGRW